MLNFFENYLILYVSGFTTGFNDTRCFLSSIECAFSTDGGQHSIEMQKSVFLSVVVS